MVSKLKIVVDSREQLPMWSGGECFKTALNVGDYTTINLLNKFHIERKSLSDLYSTIIQNHKRFRKEILRAWDSKIILVVYVEGSKKDFINKRFPGGDRRNIESTTLEKICNTIQERYDLEIVWCKSRLDCKLKILKRLKNEEHKLRS